jgi:hypothetical protein
MTTSLQSYPRTGPVDNTEEYRRIYQITINQGAFNSTASSTASGGVTPKTYRDFGGTFPSSINNGLRLARGGLRYRKMIEQLSLYTNCKVLRITSDSSEAASTQITTLTLNVEFENASYIPTTATSIDGSTVIRTREAVIQGLVYTALASSFTERMEYYDTTDNDPSANTVLRGDTFADVTATAVIAGMPGEILEAITVTRIVNADKFRDDEISSGGLE